MLANDDRLVSRTVTLVGALAGICLAYLSSGVAAERPQKDAVQRAEIRARELQDTEGPPDLLAAFERLELFLVADQNIVVDDGRLGAARATPEILRAHAATEVDPVTRAAE